MRINTYIVQRAQPSSRLDNLGANRCVPRLEVGVGHLQLLHSLLLCFKLAHLVSQDCKPQLVGPYDSVVPNRRMANL